MFLKKLNFRNYFEMKSTVTFLLIFFFAPHYALAIIGGQEATSQEYPEQVKFADSCSGTIINKNYILTAAHCFYSPLGAPAHNINIGKNILIKSHYLGKRIRKRVKAIKIHPTYLDAIKLYRNRATAARYSHDIALLKVSSINNIPVANINYDQKSTDQIITATGNGCTTEKTKGPFKYLKTTVSEKDLRIITGDKILTTSTENGQLCSGDSGGGVYDGTDVIAVNSGKININETEDYNLHVDLSYHKEWIEKHLND